MTKNPIRNRRVKGKRFESQVAKMIYTAFKESKYKVFHKLDPKESVRRRRVWEVDSTERGDILIQDPILKKAFPWCVECKCQKVIPDLEKLLVKRSKIFQKMWEQAVGQAIEMKNFPILVWRKTQSSPILCAIPAEMDMSPYNDGYYEDYDTMFEYFTETVPILVLEFKVFLNAAVSMGARRLLSPTGGGIKFYLDGMTYLTPKFSCNGMILYD